MRRENAATPGQDRMRYVCPGVAEALCGYQQVRFEVENNPQSNVDNDTNVLELRTEEEPGQQVQRTL